MKKTILSVLIIFFSLHPCLSSSNTLFKIVPVLAAYIEPYDRDEWGYWQTTNGINTVVKFSSVTLA